MATQEEVVKLSFELTEKVPGAGKKIATSLNTLAASIKKLTELKVPAEIDEALVSIAASSKAAAAGAAELKKAVTGLATPLNNSAKALTTMKEALAGNNIGLNLKKIGTAAGEAKKGITELNKQQVTSVNKTKGAGTIVAALEGISTAALAAKTMILSLNATPITGGVAAGGAGAGAKGAAAGIAQLQALMGGALLGTLATVKKETEGVTNAMTEMGEATTSTGVQSTASMSKWDHYRGVVGRAAEEFGVLSAAEKDGIKSSSSYNDQISARRSNLTALNNIIRDAGNELSAYEQKYPDPKKRTAGIKQEISQRKILQKLAKEMVELETPKLEETRGQAKIFQSQEDAVTSASAAYKKLNYAQADLAETQTRLAASGKSDADKLRGATRLLDSYDKKIATVRNTLSDLLTDFQKNPSTANSKAIQEQIRLYNDLRKNLISGRQDTEDAAKSFKGMTDAEKKVVSLNGEVDRLKDGMVKTTVATKDFSEAVSKGVTSKSIDNTVKALRTHVGQIDRLGEKYGEFATKDQGLITLRKGLTDLIAVGEKASKSVIDSKKPISNVKNIIPEVRKLEGVLGKLESKSKSIGKSFAGGLGGEVKQGVYGDALREIEGSLDHLRSSAGKNLTQVRNLQDGLVNQTGADAQKIKKSLKDAATGYTKIEAEAKRSLQTVRTQQKDYGLHGEALAQLGIPAATLRGITEEGAVMSRGVAKSFEYIGKSAGRSSTQMRTVSLALNDLEKQFVRFRSGVVTWSTGLLMLGAAVSAPFIIAIRSTAKLSDSLGIVKGITNATAVEFENLKETAEVMGRTTRFTAIEAAKGLEFLGRAGFDAATAAAALPVALKLAQAAAIDLGKAADIVTNMMTAFGLSMEEIPHAADVMTAAVTNSNATLQELGTGFTYIGSLASSMGADLEDLVAALAKLHNAGFKGTMAGTALRGTLAALVNPTKDEAELLGELSERIGGLGLVIKNAEGDFVGFGNVIRQLEDASFTADEALRLFGKRAGPGVAALLKIGSDEIFRFTQTLKDSDGITSDIAATMEVTLAGSFKKLYSAMEGLALSVGNNLTPALQFATEVITNFINKFVEFREVIGPFAVLMDIFVTSIAALTAVLGAATFAWFLMLVPAVQFISFAHVFITAMSSVAVHLRKGTIATKGFTVATKAMNVALASNHQILKAGNVVVAANSAAWMARQRAMTTSSVLNAKTIAAQNAAMAATSVPGKTAAALRAKDMLQDLKGLKSKIKEIFLGIGIFGREIFISFGKEVSKAFVAAGGGAAAFAAKTGIASKAMLVLSATFGTFLTIIAAHPVIAALTAIGITMLLIGKNSKVMSKELQDSIDVLEFTASESKRHLGAIEDAYKTLQDTPTELVNGDIYTEQFNIIQDHLGDLLLELEKLEDVEVKAEFDDGIKDFVRYEVVIKKTGESFVLLSKDIQTAEDNVRSIEKVLKALKSAGVAIDIQTDEEAYSKFSEKVQITVKELNALELKMQLVQARIDELKNPDVTAVLDFGYTEDEIERLNGVMVDLVKKYRLATNRSQEFAAILKDTSSIAVQEIAIRKLAKEAYETDAWFGGVAKTTRLESWYNEINRGFQEFKKLNVEAEKIKKAATVQNLAGGVQALDKSVSRSLESLKELAEETKKEIEEALDFRGTKVDFQLTDIENDLKAELSALQFAQKEKLSLYQLSAKDHYNLKLREAAAVVEFEQLKLIVIKKSNDEQRAIEEEFYNYKRQHLSSLDYEGQYEAEKARTEASIALLEKEVSAAESARAKMLSGRIALQKKLISIEEQRIKFHEKIQKSIEKLEQADWSDRRKQRYAEQKFDELLSKARLALVKGEVNQAEKLLEKAYAQGSIRAGLFDDDDRSGRNALKRDLEELAKLADLIAVDKTNQTNSKIDLFNAGIDKMTSSIEKLVKQLEVMQKHWFEIFKQFAQLKEFEDVPDTGIKKIGQEAETSTEQVKKLNEEMAQVGKNPVQAGATVAVELNKLPQRENKEAPIKIIDEDQIDLALSKLETGLQSTQSFISAKDSQEISELARTFDSLTNSSEELNQLKLFENIDTTKFKNDLYTIYAFDKDIFKPDQAIEKGLKESIQYVYDSLNQMKRNIATDPVEVPVTVSTKATIPDIAKLLQTNVDPIKVPVDVEVEINEGDLQKVSDINALVQTNVDPIKVPVDDSNLQAAIALLYEFKPRLKELEGEELKLFSGINTDQLDEDLATVSKAAAGEKVEGLAEAVKGVNTSIGILKANSNEAGQSVEVLSLKMKTLVETQSTVDDTAFIYKSYQDALKPVIDLGAALTNMKQAGTQLRDVEKDLSKVRAATSDKAGDEDIKNAADSLQAYKEQVADLDKLLNKTDRLGIDLTKYGITADMREDIRTAAKSLRRNWVAEFDNAKKNDSLVDYQITINNTVKDIQKVIDYVPSKVKQSISGLETEFKIKYKASLPDQKELSDAVANLNEQTAKGFGKARIDATGMRKEIERLLNIYSKLTGQVVDLTNVQSRNSRGLEQDFKSSNFPKALALDPEVVREDINATKRLSAALLETSQIYKSKDTETELEKLAQAFRRLESEIVDALEIAKASLDDLLETANELGTLREMRVELADTKIQEQLDDELRAIEMSHQERLALYELTADEGLGIGLRETQAIIEFEQQKLAALKKYNDQKRKLFEKENAEAVAKIPDDKSGADARLEAEKKLLDAKKDLLQQEKEANQTFVDSLLKQRKKLQESIKSLGEQRVEDHKRVEEKIRGIDQRTWSDKKKQRNAESRLDRAINKGINYALLGQADKARKALEEAEQIADEVEGLLDEKNRRGFFNLKTDYKSIDNAYDLLQLVADTKADRGVKNLNAELKVAGASAKVLQTEMKAVAKASDAAVVKAQVEKEFAIDPSKVSQAKQLEMDAELAQKRMQELYQFIDQGAKKGIISVVDDKDVERSASLLKDSNEIVDLFKTTTSDQLDFNLLDPDNLKAMQGAFEDFHNMKSSISAQGGESLYDGLDLGRVTSALAMLQLPNLNEVDRARNLKIVVDEMARMEQNLHRLYPANEQFNQSLEGSSPKIVKLGTDIKTAGTAVNALQGQLKDVEATNKTIDAWYEMSNAAEDLKEAQKELKDLGPVTYDNLEEAVRLVNEVDLKLDSLEQSITKAQSSGVEYDLLKINFSDVETAKQQLKELDQASAEFVANQKTKFQPGDGFMNLLVVDLQSDVNSAKTILDSLESKVNATVSGLDASIKIKVEVQEPDLQKILNELNTLRQNTNLGSLDINVNPVISELQRVIDMWKEIIRLKNEAQSNSTGGVITGGSFQTGGIIPGYQTGGVISNIKEKITEFKEKVVHLATGGTPFKRPSYSKVPGSGSGDRVPAMLEAGEYIIKKQTVQALGIPFLNMLNKGALQLFNAGGQVASMPGSITSALSHIQMPAPVLHFQQGGVVAATTAGPRETVDIWLRLGEDRQKYLVQSPKDQATQLVNSLKHLSRGLKTGR